MLLLTVIALTVAGPVALVWRDCGVILECATPLRCAEMPGPLGLSAAACMEAILRILHYAVVMPGPQGLPTGACVEAIGSACGVVADSPAGSHPLALGSCTPLLVPRLPPPGACGCAG